MSRGMMMMTVLIAVLILIFSITSLIIYIRNSEKRKNKKLKKGKYSEGHFMGIGMIFGMPVGFALAVPYGLIIQNVALSIAFGSALGAGIGMIIGTALESKYQDEMIPLTKREKRIKNWTRFLLLTMIFAFIIIGLMIRFRFFG